MTKDKLLKELQELKKELQEENKVLESSDNDGSYRYDIGYNDGYIGAIRYISTLIKNLEVNKHEND